MNSKIYCTLWIQKLRNILITKYLRIHDDDFLMTLKVGIVVSRVATVASDDEPKWWKNRLFKTSWRDVTSVGRHPLPLDACYCCRCQSCRETLFIVSFFRNSNVPTVIMSNMDDYYLAVLRLVKEAGSVSKGCLSAKSTTTKEQPHAVSSYSWLTEGPVYRFCCFGFQSSSRAQSVLRCIYFFSIGPFPVVSFNWPVIQNYFTRQWIISLFLGGYNKRDVNIN